MAIKFVNVGGIFEAAWDGQSMVVVRQMFTAGPNFHLTRASVAKLLELFPGPVVELDELSRRNSTGSQPAHTLEDALTWVQRHVSHTSAQAFARDMGLRWDLHHSADKPVGDLG